MKDKTHTLSERNFLLFLFSSTSGQCPDSTIWVATRNAWPLPRSLIPCNWIYEQNWVSDTQRIIRAIVLEILIQLVSNATKLPVGSWSPWMVSILRQQLHVQKREHEVCQFSIDGKCSNTHLVNRGLPVQHYKKIGMLLKAICLNICIPTWNGTVTIILYLLLFLCSGDPRQPFFQGCIHWIFSSRILVLGTNEPLQNVKHHWQLSSQVEVWKVEEKQILIPQNDTC